MPKKSLGSSKSKKDELKKSTDTEVDTLQEEEEEKETEDTEIDLSKLEKEGSDDLADDDAFPDDTELTSGFPGEEDDDLFDTDEDEDEEEYNGEVE